MTEEIIRVLLVEDDEDDYVIVRDLFEDTRGKRFDLEPSIRYALWKKRVEERLRESEETALGLQGARTY